MSLPISENTLTETERRAYNYLRDNGYKNLKRGTGAGMPDFVGEENFEVKKGTKNSATFTDNQLAVFPKMNPFVIFVNNGEIEIVEFSDLEIEGKEIVKVTVRMTPNLRDKIKDEILSETRLYTSISDYIRQVVRLDITKREVK